jgi:predicted transcriptional regulator
MSNIYRRRSNYEYQLPPQQLAELMEIAFREDCSLQTLIRQAIDEYIEREEEACANQ